VGHQCGDLPNGGRSAGHRGWRLGRRPRGAVPRERLFDVVHVTAASPPPRCVGAVRGVARRIPWWRVPYVVSLSIGYAAAPAVPADARSPRGGDRRESRGPGSHCRATPRAWEIVPNGRRYRVLRPKRRSTRGQSVAAACWSHRSAATIRTRRRDAAHSGSYPAPKLTVWARPWRGRLARAARALGSAVRFVGYAGLSAA